VKDPVERLKSLVLANPGLELVPFIWSEVYFSDGSKWWAGEIKEVFIGEYYSYKGSLYYKDHEFDDLFQRIMKERIDNIPSSSLELTRLEIQVTNEILGFPWKKAIIVYISEQGRG